MNKFKLIYQALTVFLPILVKGLWQLYKELTEAYSEENLKYLENIGETAAEIAKEGFHA